MDKYTRDHADELADEYYQVNYNDSLGIRVSKRNKKAKELEEEEKAKSERIAKEKAATKERDKAAKAKASGDIEAAEKAAAEERAAAEAKKEARAAVAEEAASKSAVNEAYKAVETALYNYWAIPIDVEKIEETRAALSESREAFVNAIKKLMPELSALEVLQNEARYVQDIINNVQEFFRGLGVVIDLRERDDDGLEELKEILEELIEADIAEEEKASAAKDIARALVLGQDLDEDDVPSGQGYAPLTPDTEDRNMEDNGANLEQEESSASARAAAWAEALVEDGVHNGVGYVPLTPENATHDVEDDFTVVRTPLETSGGWKYTDLLDEC